MQSENGTQLIIVRHGQATHNLGKEEQHTFAGSEIDCDLAPQGIVNAEFLANTIKRDGAVDAIITSPLKRASQTAEIINRLIGNVPLFTIDELKEINMGKFAGLTEAEARKLFPDAARNFYGEEIDEWDFPGGEDFSQVSERLDVALVKIREIVKGKKRVIICGHGLTNRVLFYKLKPEDQSLWIQRSYPHDRIEYINIGEGV